MSEAYQDHQFEALEDNMRAFLDGTRQERVGIPGATVGAKRGSRWVSYILYRGEF